MSSATIDLRQNAQTIIQADQNTSGVITWAGIDAMDVAYSLTVAGETYTVGDGLALGVDSIAWAFPVAVTDETGTFDGELVSQSKVVGVYLRILIKLIVS